MSDRPGSANIAPTHRQWERLRRLTYLRDETGPLDELRGVLVEIGAVSPVPLPTSSRDSSPTLEAGALADTCLDLARHLLEGRVSGADGDLARRLCRRAYAFANTSDGWPISLPVTESGRIAVGLVFRSLSGAIEGRSTGGRRRCPAHGCPGWLVGVLWETGQQLHVCSEGWHHDPESCELRIVGGGEISARFVSPPPLGVPPRPRREWPPRSQLERRPAWAT